jgi:hypothetical protein
MYKIALLMQYVKLVIDKLLANIFLISDETPYVVFE